MTPEEESRKTLLEALLVDYSEARDDERYWSVAQGTAFTVALAALSLLGILVTENIKLLADTKGARGIPDALLACTPLSILAILAFVTSAGVQAIIRNFYMRALEREIRKLIHFDGGMDGIDGLLPLSHIEFQTAYTSMGDGKHSHSSQYRFMVGAVLAVLWLLLGGLTFYLGIHVSPPWAMLMLLVYPVGAGWIFGHAIRSNKHGREIFVDNVKTLGERIALPLTPITPSGGTEAKKHGRSLLGYLALPRPDDLVKAVYVVLGMACGWLILGRDRGAARPPVAELAAFAVGLELLVYQSRYQWNDLRGVFEDGTAPLSAARGRLPGGKGSIRASVLTMIVRIYLVGWIVAIQFGPGPRISRTDHVLLVGVVAVYILAAWYESHRARLRRSRLCSSAQLAHLLVIIGLGYPLRFCLGLLAVGASMSALDWLGIVVGFWALGLLLVTMTWVLEGASYITKKATRGEYLLSTDIRRKPHLLRLMWDSGIACETCLDLPGVDVSGPDLKILQEARRSGVSYWFAGGAVWTFLIGGIAGRLAGLPELSVGAPAFWAAACWVLLVPVRFKGGVLAPLVGSIVLLSGYASALVGNWSTYQSVGGLASRLAVVAVLALLAPVYFAYFWSTTYRETRNSAFVIVGVLAEGAHAIGRWFLQGPDGPQVGRFGPGRPTSHDGSRTS